MKREQFYYVELEEVANFTYMVVAKDPAGARTAAIAKHKQGSPVGRIAGIRAGKCVCLGALPKKGKKRET